jgi:hypothetical protein
MAKKKVFKKSLKDKFNAAYDKMQSARTKERSCKSCKNGCKNGCDCGR